MPPTLSTPVAVVMILSLLLGALNQIIQTGALFGQIIPPKAWMPEFVITATFLGGIVSFFAGLSPVVINATTIFYAIAAGVSNLLVASTPALVVHTHYVMPAQYKALRARQLTTFAQPPPPPPPAAAPPVQT